ELPVIGERDVHAVEVSHHVVVRQDVAILAHDETRPAGCTWRGFLELWELVEEILEPGLVPLTTARLLLLCARLRTLGVNRDHGRRHELGDRGKSETEFRDRTTDRCGRRGGCDDAARGTRLRMPQRREVESRRDDQSA